MLPNIFMIMKKNIFKDLNELDEKYKPIVLCMHIA